MISPLSSSFSKTSFNRELGVRDPRLKTPVRRSLSITVQKPISPRAHSKKVFHMPLQDEKEILCLKEIRSRLIEIKERVASEKNSLDSLIFSLLHHQKSRELAKKRFENLQKEVDDRNRLMGLQQKHLEKLQTKSKEQDQLIIESTAAKMTAFKTAVQIEKNALLRAEKNLHQASFKERFQMLFSPSIRREILLRNHPLKARNCTAEELALTIVNAAKKNRTHLLIFRSKWENFQENVRTKIKRARLYLRSFYFRFCNWLKNLCKTLKKAFFCKWV